MTQILFGALLILLSAAPARATTYTYESSLITGTATFAADTSSFTGTLFIGSDSLTLVSGPHIANGTPLSHFSFNSGLITAWYASGFAAPSSCGAGNCIISTGVDYGYGPFDELFHQCGLSCSPYGPVPWLGVARAPVGSWTMVTPSPVPGPALGTGLPALMTLLAWWLRSRRQ